MTSHAVRVGRSERRPRGAAHLAVVGTHLGRRKELEATGRRLAREHMFFVRFDVQLVAEMWEVFDPAQITNQLTAAESSG